jgi:hypothetical protein
MLATAALSLPSPSPPVRPESAKRRAEVMGESVSSLKETSASTFSYLLKVANAGGPSWARLLSMKHASCACF